MVCLDQSNAIRHRRAAASPQARLSPNALVPYLTLLDLRILKYQMKINFKIKEREEGRLLKKKDR